MIQKMAESRTTTVVGSLSVLGGILMTLIPENIRTSCVDAVNATSNPVTIGLLLVGGIGCTIIGPSFLKKKE